MKWSRFLLTHYIDQRSEKEHRTHLFLQKSYGSFLLRFYGLNAESKSFGNLFILSPLHVEDKNFAASRRKLIYCTEQKAIYLFFISLFLTDFPVRVLHIFDVATLHMLMLQVV